MRQEELNKLQALKEKLNSENAQNNGVKHIDSKVEHRESNNVHSNGSNVAINKTNYTHESGNNTSFNGQQFDIKRGDMFWTDITGKIVGSEQGGKVYPTICLQNNIGNKYSPTIIIAIITSQLDKNKLPTHVKLDGYGLPKNSVVLLEQVRTIDKRRLVGYIGHVDEETMRLIDNAKDISMSELKPKSLLERLPEMMRTFIVSTLKQIKKYEITVETMKNEGMTDDDVQFIVNKKLSVLNKFIKYCKEHQIDYTAFYKLNEGVVNKEIVL